MKTYAYVCRSYKKKLMKFNLYSILSKNQIIYFFDKKITSIMK